MVSVEPKNRSSGSITANPSTARTTPVTTDDTSPTEAIVPAWSISCRPSAREM